MTKESNQSVKRRIVIPGIVTGLLQAPCFMMALFWMLRHGLFNAHLEFYDVPVALALLLAPLIILVRWHWVLHAEQDGYEPESKLGAAKFFAKSLGVSILTALVSSFTSIQSLLIAIAGIFIENLANII